MKQSHKERWEGVATEDLAKFVRDSAAQAKSAARHAALHQADADSMRKELRRRKREGRQG